jgi:hypothetical protein
MSESTDRERKRRREFGQSSGRVGENLLPPDAREGDAADSADVLPPLSGSPVLGSGRRRVVGPVGGQSPSANNSDALPPEADGANPLTLSPSDPNRDSQEGQPYLDDANPYGRQLENRRNRPIGGIGTRVDPRAAERPTDRTEPPSKQ